MSLKSESGESIVKEVVFFLHPKLEAPIVARSEQPYEVSGSGQSSFLVHMALSVKDSFHCEKIEVEHELCLKEPESSVQKTIAIRSYPSYFNQFQTKVETISSY